MSFNLAQLLALIVIYLGVLFLVALLTDRGLVPKRITRHPAVYVLSLGVFAGAMATNGIYNLAFSYGYNFLFYYLGMVLVLLLASVILLPLLRLCRIYQLSSIADVLVQHGHPVDRSVVGTRNRQPLDRWRWLLHAGRCHNE